MWRGGGVAWVGETCESHRHELQLDTSCRFTSQGFHSANTWILKRNIHSNKTYFKSLCVPVTDSLRTFKSVLLPAPISTLFHHPLTVKSSSAHTLDRCPSPLTPYLLLHLGPLPAPLSPPARVRLPASLPTMSVTDYLSTSPLFFAGEISSNYFLEVCQ